MVEPSNRTIGVCLFCRDSRDCRDWIEQAGGSNTRKQGKDAAAAAAKSGKKGRQAATEEDGEDGAYCNLRRPRDPRATVVRRTRGHENPNVPPESGSGGCCDLYTHVELVDSVDQLHASRDK